MLDTVRHATVVRGPVCYYWRVPAHAADGFGQRAVRYVSGRDEDDAQAVAAVLSAEAAKYQPSLESRLLCFSTVEGWLSDGDPETH